MPSRSTCSRQRVQVSSVTSWPRRASSLPSAIAGNACPASPNAPMRNFTPVRSHQLDQLSHHPQAVLLGRGRRRDEERADTGVAVVVEALLDDIAGAAKRDLIDQL